MELVFHNGTCGLLRKKNLQLVLFNTVEHQELRNVLQAEVSAADLVPNSQIFQSHINKS